MLDYIDFIIEMLHFSCIFCNHSIKCKKVHKNLIIEVLDRT